MVRLSAIFFWQHLQGFENLAGTKKDAAAIPNAKNIKNRTYF
jgi:hypothetical protein